MPRRPHTGPLTLVARWALAVLVVSTAGCSLLDDETITTPSGPPPTVDADLALAPVILGDSLTVSATEQLADWLPDAVIDAFPGRTMATPQLSDAAIDRVVALPTEPGRPWFVALGTNDAGFNVLTPDQLQADLTRLLDAIGDERCVWWVLPYVTAPQPPESIESVDRFADVIRATIERRPCGGVLDWPAAVRSTPGLLLPDGVHLTDAGIGAFVSLIVTQAAALAEQQG